MTTFAGSSRTGLTTMTVIEAYKAALADLEALRERKNALEEKLYFRSDRPIGSTEEIDTWMHMHADESRLEHVFNGAREDLIDWALGLESRIQALDAQVGVHIHVAISRAYRAGHDNAIAHVLNLFTGEEQDG